MPRKTCTRCKTAKPATEKHFQFRRPDKKWGLDSWCRACRREISALWLEKNRESQKIKRTEQRAAIRLQILTHYANGAKPACECCKEPEIKFLALDHIKGGGHKHRLEVGRGGSFYQWLRRQGLPEGFRVLCHNCNLAIGLYGKCPHKA